MQQDLRQPANAQLEERIRELERELAEITSKSRELEGRIEERAVLYRMIRDVSAFANRTDSVADVVRGALLELCERGGWTLAHLYYYDEPTATLLPSNAWQPEHAPGYDAFRASSWKAHFAPGEGVVGEVFESGEPREVTDLAAALGPVRSGHEESGLCRGLFLPSRPGGSHFGVLELFSEDPTPALRMMVKAMGLVAHEIAQVMLRKQTEALTAQLEAKQQQRIGRELHDGLGQLVSGIGMLAQGLLHRLELRGAEESTAAADLVQRLEEAKLQLRSLVRGLMPVYSGSEGLVDALDRLVDESQTASGVRCSFESQLIDGVSDSFAARHLYYIAQEAVSNAIRHARASNVVVRLEQTEGRLVLSIRDDGVGIPPERADSGSGLRIMRHRAALMAARLVVESAPGGGTLVSCRIRIGTGFRPPGGGDTVADHG